METPTAPAHLNGHPRSRPLRVGLFTDTFDDINGVGRFIRDMAEQARAHACDLVVFTSVRRVRHDVPNRVNFEPAAAWPMPFYATLDLTVPPVARMLAAADERRFDAVHVSTPGIVGTVGLLAARALRVPMLATYHTDFPAYVRDLVGGRLVVGGTEATMRLFYARCARVFSRSAGFQDSLVGLGLPRERLRLIKAAVNTRKFSPAHRDADVWRKLGVREPHVLFYAGRISVEKNLPLLVKAYRQLCARRRDAALVIAGEGPYEKSMRAALADVPAYFLGPQNDLQLGPLYAGASLFVFPSRTDTLGQVVMEAQSSGLATLVAPEGGPSEVIEPGVTGLVIDGARAEAWAETIDVLLDDPARRARMGAAALARSRAYDLGATFRAWWAEHEAACCA